MVEVLEVTTAMKQIAALLIALVLAILAWTIYPDKVDEDRPDPGFLATDVFFRLGDVVISVPVVSVQRLTEPPINSEPLPKFRRSGPFGEPRWFATQEYKAAMRKLASERTQPAEVSTIWLNFGPYGTYGEHSVSRGICPKLSSEWSQKACHNQLRTELKNLPTEFHLSTETGLEVFANHHFESYPNTSVAALIDEVRPVQKVGKAACADGKRGCYAAILVTDELFAIWPYVCAGASEEICRNKLEAEGAEIQNFVRTELRTD
ncbi:MAG: hypothetical protein AB3N21_09865 [Ruegeria sp.]|uniref:hypothetical protein n=1 Tax=Ruegeria sp. TaxID=1879320 RepID=UPI00349EC48B